MWHTWGNLSHPTPPQQKWMNWGGFVGDQEGLKCRLFLDVLNGLNQHLFIKFEKIGSKQKIYLNSHTTICFWPCPLSLATWMLFALTPFFPTNINPQNQNSKTLQHLFVKLNLNHLRFLFCFHATFVLLWFCSICTFGTIVGGLQCRVGRTFSAGFGTGVRAGENVEQWKKRTYKMGP